MLLGAPRRHRPLPLLRIQQRTVLLHLHHRRHRADLRLCADSAEDQEEPVGDGALEGDLPLLHPNIRTQEHPLPNLQSTHLPTQGYLPNDETGNFIFKVQEFLATLLSAYVLYSILVLFKSSYSQDLDTVKCYYLIALALVLALLFHSSLNRSFFGDFTWAFTQYL